MLQRLFHVNICVRDMDRSVRFYEDVGFTKVNDFILDDPNLGPGLGVEMKKLRGVFMRVGDDPNAPALDLVQFLEPSTQGQPYASLNNVGNLPNLLLGQRHRRDVRAAQDQGHRVRRTAHRAAGSEQLPGQIRMLQGPGWYRSGADGFGLSHTFSTLCIYLSARGQVRVFEFRAANRLRLRAERPDVDINNPAGRAAGRRYARWA